MSAEQNSDESQSDEVFSALDCLAEVCLIYRSEKGVIAPEDECSENKFPPQNPHSKQKIPWSNSRLPQEPTSSTIIKNDSPQKLSQEPLLSGVTPSCFLSVRTEIKKGKNVNMDYMRSDRLWTLCLRLDGAHHLKRLGFHELKAQVFICREGLHTLSPPLILDKVPKRHRTTGKERMTKVDRPRNVVSLKPTRSGSAWIFKGIFKNALGCLGKVRFVARVLSVNRACGQSTWVPKGLLFTDDITKPKPYNGGGCLLVRPGTPNPALAWINYSTTRLHEIRTKSYAKRSPPPMKLLFPSRTPNALPLKLLANDKSTEYITVGMGPLVKRKRSSGVMNGRFHTPHTPEMSAQKYLPSPKRPCNHLPEARQWTHPGYRGPEKHMDWRSVLHMPELGLEHPAPVVYRYV